MCAYKLVPNPLQVCSYHCDLCLTRVVVCSCTVVGPEPLVTIVTSFPRLGEEFWIHSYMVYLATVQLADCSIVLLNVVNWNFNSVIGLWWASLIISTLSKLIQQSIFPRWTCKVAIVSSAVRHCSGPFLYHNGPSVSTTQLLQQKVNCRVDSKLYFVNLNIIKIYNTHQK